jgi:outer membrane protein
MHEHRGGRRRPIRSLATALATLLLASTPAIATPEGVEVTAAPVAASGPANLRIEDGQMHLSVEEAVALALQRSLGLQVQRYGRQQARVGVDEALGVYDLGLTSALSAAHQKQPAASNLQGASVQKQDSASFSVGLSKLLPSGGVGSVSWANDRLKTNNQFYLLNPSYSSGLNLSLSQPLLRGFGREQTEFGIRVARLQSDVARTGFVNQVVGTIRQAEIAYWNLVAARDQLEVAKESLALAQQLHQDNKVRVEVGTLAPLELASSEAGVAARQEDIIRAQGAVGDAEDVLRYLLNLDDPKTWSLPVVPDTAVEMPMSKVDLDSSLAAALKDRPELAQQEIAQTSREVEAVYYRGQLMPRLDLKASYGFNGVGGDALVRDAQGNVISSSPGGWGDALDQITGFDFPGWSVGVEFGYPLSNRTAKAKSTLANLAVEQGKVGLEQLRQQVQAEVRVAVRGLETARQQIESARVSVTLAEKNLDAERKKYENGLSTSFEILSVQDDLSAARSRLVAALTGYRTALVEYHRAVGNLPDFAGVAITD